MIPTKPSLRVKTLMAQAYELMRQKIVTGEWPQGIHLKDNELAMQLGISATPVREALRKLASEGLVQNIPYKGMFVTSLSASQIKELLNVRLGLELMALESGLSLLSGAELDAMEQALADFDQALAQNNLVALLAADTAFHGLIVQASGNSVLNELYRQLTGRVQMLMAIADLSGRMATGNVDHRQILQAMRARQLPEATTALRNHLVATRDALLAVTL